MTVGASRCSASVQTHTILDLRFRWEKTRIGYFLYNTRLEALPQLINVLRGEMSFADLTLFD